MMQRTYVIDPLYYWRACALLHFVRFPGGRWWIRSAAATNSFV